MEQQGSIRNTENNQMNNKLRWILIGDGILFAFSIIAGIIWKQLYIPLGSFFVLVAISILLLKLTFDNGLFTFGFYVLLVIVLIVGGVLLYKGFTDVFNQQDDLQYTKSLGVSVEEILATTNSEGTRYAVVLDGVLSRRLLPEEYQAKLPEDIGAVLIINTAYDKVGQYSGGGTAYKAKLKIQLKSLKTGETFVTETLTGEDPPSSIRVSPLDPNRDRYGKLPSDEKIKATCVSMIEKAKKEEERKNKVTLLSAEELLDFAHQKITQTVGEDGWAGINNVQMAMKEAEPNFSIEDYGYKSLISYFESDPHFFVKKRDLSDAMAFFTSQDYVRWTDE